MEAFDFSNRDLYNHAYIPLLHDNSRYKILYGGRDSGKSDFVAQALIIGLIKEEFFRLILVRKYYAHIESSQYQTMVDYIKLWELSDIFHITQKPLGITCKLNGNKILARGLDKADNTKSIKDPTAVWYEEANQIPADAFRTTSQSVRSSRSKNLVEWITFNPQQESCHINEYFFPLKNTYERDDGNFLWVPSKQPDTKIIHTTYKQNRFVTQQRINVLESYKNIDLNYYNVNTLGLWGGALRGLIYPNFYAEDEFPDAGDDVFGLDYGFVNPTALVHTTYYEGDLHIHELLYQTGLTHANVVDILRTDFRDIIGRKLIIVDSAVPELVADLKRAGFNARPAVKGPDSVLKGIHKVHELNLYVTKCSSNVIAEFQSYIWKENKDGKALEEPVKVNDHAMDAIRYVVQTYGVKHWLKNVTVRDRTERQRPARIIKNKYSSY